MKGATAAADIGGAHIKCARSDGRALSRPFALWKEPERLARVLGEALVELGRHDELAVTLTAELCDCFRTRAEGVRHVLVAAREATARTPLRVWLIDGRLVPVEEALGAPRLAAAANWLALATWAAGTTFGRDALLIDIGSTTADIVAIREGRPIPAARTDTGRLQTGELVYTGVERTPLCALVSSVHHRGRTTRVAAELFATTLDAYLVLGDLRERPDERDTADGRPASRQAAAARIARTVCADPEEFGIADAREVAREVAGAQLAELEAAARSVVSRAGGPAGVALVSGSGEFLAERLARRLGFQETIRLSREIGDSASRAACAYALARIAAGE